MARPLKCFNDFIGQRDAIKVVRTLVDGAQVRGIPPPSFLLIARPGQGKTALAEAICREYNGENSDGSLPSFHRIIGGPRISKDICEELHLLHFGDVLLIDEAHSFDRDGQELLLITLDSWKTFQITEKGCLNRRAFDSVAPFCLILATSEPGKVLPALKDRLNVIEFERYNLNELKAIAHSEARRNGVALTGQAARALAQRSQGSPRQISLHIETLQSYYPAVSRFGQDQICTYLADRGIDQFGLGPKQREYLRALAEAPKQTSSIERLKAKIGLDFVYLRREVETFLIDAEFVEVTSARSRTLTGAGQRVLEEAST